MIFDILSSDITVGGSADFVATTPGAVQQAVTNAPVAGLDFSDANGNKWITAGDNLLITRLWCNIPHGFGQGSGEHSIGLVFKDSLGNAAIITELAGNSVLTLPQICSPFEFVTPDGGLYLSVPKNLGKVKFNLSNIALNVSQINLPAALNGTTIKVQYHVEVIHTKALAGVP